MPPASPRGGPQTPRVAQDVQGDPIARHSALIQAIDAAPSPEQKLEAMRVATMNTAAVFSAIEEAIKRIEQTLQSQTSVTATVSAEATQAASERAQQQQQMQQLSQEVRTIGQAMQALNSNQQQLQQQQAQQTAATGNANSFQKPLSESKCITNLKTLGSDKSEFKVWNEKLINATTQSIGSDWRKFMRELNERLDLDRKVLTVAEISQLPSASKIANPKYDE